MSKEFTCNRGKNEKEGPCKKRLYYDPQVLSQHGRQMPLEVNTGKPHNCPFGRAVLDHPDIVKDYENAWQYWEKDDVEKLRNEFEKWKNEMIKAKFPNASKEALEKWRIEIPEIFLRRLSKDLKRTPNAVREQLQHMGLIEH
jgi:hypothetical protein